MRTRAERRKNTWKKATRQVEIEKNAEGKWGKDHKPFLKFVHAYSKNRVPYADPEEKFNFEPSKSDQRKLDSLASQEEEWSDAS